jgi:hypothetical protein
MPFSKDEIDASMSRALDAFQAGSDVHQWAIGLRLYLPGVQSSVERGVTTWRIFEGDRLHAIIRQLPDGRRC